MPWNTIFNFWIKWTSLNIWRFTFGLTVGRAGSWCLYIYIYIHIHIHIHIYTHTHTHIHMYICLRNRHCFAVFIQPETNTRRRLGELESCCVRPRPKVEGLHSRLRRRKILIRLEEKNGIRLSCRVDWAWEKHGSYRARLFTRNIR